MSTRPLANKYQKKYMAKAYASGLVRVAVWVPEKYRQEIIDLAQKLRDKTTTEDD